MISQEALKNLKEIMNRDYGLIVSDDQATELGMSLLRLTRIGIVAITKRDENKLKIEKNVKSKL